MQVDVVGLYELALHPASITENLLSIAKVFRRLRHQILVNRAQFVVGHVTVGFPRHVIGVDPSAMFFSSVHDFNKPFLAPGLASGCLCPKSGWEVRTIPQGSLGFRRLKVSARDRLCRTAKDTLHIQL